MVFLCLNEGIDPAAIDPRRPFANLMLLYEACSAEQRMVRGSLIPFFGRKGRNDGFRLKVWDALYRRVYRIFDIYESTLKG